MATKVVQLTDPLTGDNLLPIGVVSGENVQMDLLWTNRATSSSFAAQTVGIASLSSYEKVGISWLHRTSGRQYLFSITDVGATGFANYITNDADKTNRGRDFESNTTSVVFSDAKATNVVNNVFCIPYQIYGIKGVN